MKSRYLLFALFLIPQVTIAQSFLTAQLTPAQETEDVTSNATGTAAFALTDEGLRFFVTVDSLTGPITNAHFHIGAPGISGPPVRGILDDFEGNSASGIWTASDAEPLTDELITELFAGNLYVNVHTEQYPAGEIRGQILPTSGTGLRSVLTPAQTGEEVESSGSGTASIQLTDAGVLYFVTVNNLTGPITNAHFHRGAIGTNGPVVHGIFDNFEGNTAFGLWTESGDQPLTEENIVELLTGRLYLNVHTQAYPAGEIHGQVLPAGGWGFTAEIDTEQAGEGIVSEASGTGVFTLTEAGLIYHITFADLTGPMTNAHFHLGATGVSGPPVRGLMNDFVGTTAVGVWRPTDAEPLTDELILSLIRGDIYVNIHSEAYPAGEIRGQVLLDAGTNFYAELTPAAAGVDPELPGRGTAFFSLTPDGLAFRVTHDSLTGPLTNAHFHRGEIGVSGGVVRGIMDDYVGSTAAGVWRPTDPEPLDAEMLRDLMTGKLYLNVHTEANPAGEIRGQVLLAEGTALRAFLTNEQQSAGVEQDASGTATLTLTSSGVVYDITVDGLSGDITNAHFHDGVLGEDGGVVFGIMGDFVGNTASGVWLTEGDNALTPERVRDLLTGRLYLNVHTEANPAGEIRGQVVLSDGVGAAAQIDAGQTTGNVESNGKGTAAFTLTEAGLVFDLTIAELTGPFTNAHFHEGFLGEDGPVVRGIMNDFSGSRASGLWSPNDAEPLTTENLLTLLQGGYYVNVHTEANPAGEIRGQVLPSGIVSTDVEQTGNEVPKSFLLEQNFPNPFNPSTTIRFSLTSASHAMLTVYNILGQQVAVPLNRELSAGSFEVRFEAHDLPSGVYFYRLETKDASQVRSMLLLK